LTTFWALHLVAALLLEEPVLALGTLPYHGFRRHILQLRPCPNLLVPFDLMAGQGHVALLLALSACLLATLGVATDQNLDSGVLNNSGIIAGRALLQILQPGSLDLFQLPLLQQLVEHGGGQSFPQRLLLHHLPTACEALNCGLGISYCDARAPLHTVPADHTASSAHRHLLEESIRIIADLAFKDCATLLRLDHLQLPPLLNLGLVLPDLVLQLEVHVLL